MSGLRRYDVKVQGGYIFENGKLYGNGGCDHLFGIFENNYGGIEMRNVDEFIGFRGLKLENKQKKANGIGRFIFLEGIP